jgi:hypothetical protein
MALKVVCKHVMNVFRWHSKNKAGSQKATAKTADLEGRKRA